MVDDVRFSRELAEVNHFRLGDVAQLLGRSLGQSIVVDLVANLHDGVNSLSDTASCDQVETLFFVVWGELVAGEQPRASMAVDHFRENGMLFHGCLR